MVFKFDFISCLFNIGDDEYVKDGDGEAQRHLNWNLILLLDVIKNFRKLPCCANNFSKIWIFFFGYSKFVYRRYIVKNVVNNWPLGHRGPLHYCEWPEHPFTKQLKFFTMAKQINDYFFLIIIFWTQQE